MVQSSRANIVFVQCDSMDGRLMGSMGHPAMARATPNLDALAERGVLFRNAYCNNPICCPSRASMWSGLYTHHCEGWNNYKGLAPDDPTFRDQLDQAGYTTQTFGKTDYLSGAHSIRARVTPWTRAATIMRPSYRMPGPRVIADRRERVHERDWQDVDSSIGWLQEHARGDDGPLWLYLGIRAPHPSFAVSRRYLDLVDGAGVSVPPLDASDHPVLHCQRVAKNWMHGFWDEMVRHVRRIYFAMVAEVDAMVGQLIQAIDDSGLADSTYVIFTSDHGELAMEHGQFYKMSMYEGSARVPLIVAGPDVRKAQEIDTPVSLVDIYPTLMDMAGIERSEGLDGYSLMPELSGGASAHPGWVVSEFHGTTSNTGMTMLRQGSWKYVAYAGYEPQLFDLENDPDELRNLAMDRPGVAEEMDSLLRSIVDYARVDAQVKAYDRRSFRQWRQERLADGTYWDLMARVYSGWDDLTSEQAIPWTKEDEGQIEQWLDAGGN